MSTVLAPISAFSRDFITDIKTSRRFQICAVLWLPLIIVSFIAVVRLGIKNTWSKSLPQWNTFFIPESSGISFPDVYLNFTSPPSSADPSFTVACSQRGIFTHNMNCPSTYANQPTSQCRMLPLSNFQASNAFIGQNHVTCNVTINTLNAGSNQEMGIWMTQGYVWFPNPPTYINPNAYVRVQLFRELFQPYHQSSVYEWFAERTYESSNFNSNPTQGPFTMSLIFSIPFRAVTVHRQDVIFDDWQLLAAWGGFFTFCAFLHAVVFFFVKMYTAPDSKLLADGAGPSGPGYEPIK